MIVNILSYIYIISIYLNLIITTNCYVISYGIRYAGLGKVGKFDRVMVKLFVFLGRPDTVKINFCINSDRYDF